MALEGSSTGLKGDRLVVQLECGRELHFRACGGGVTTPSLSTWCHAISTAASGASFPSSRRVPKRLFGTPTEQPGAGLQDTSGVGGGNQRTPEDSTLYGQHAATLAWSTSSWIDGQLDRRLNLFVAAALTRGARDAPTELQV